MKNLTEKKILVIDTSYSFSVVATFQKAMIVEKIVRYSPRAASEGLVPWIMEIVSRSCWHPQSIDIIGVGLGPGSFTGTRVAVTVARGISFATGARLSGVSSIEAIALSMGGENDIVAVLMDVKKGQVCFSLHKTGHAYFDSHRLKVISETIEEPKQIKKSGVINYTKGVIKKYGNITICGDIIDRGEVEKEIIKTGARIRKSQDGFLIHPEALYNLTLNSIVKNGFSYIEELEPVYLR